jgi:putative oxidoreductase
MTDDREPNGYSHGLGSRDRLNRVGYQFFGHGAQKMLGSYGGSGLATTMRTFTEHLHLPATLAFLVIAGEFLSGIGLIVGRFSRIA